MKISSRIFIAALLAPTAAQIHSTIFRTWNASQLRSSLLHQAYNRVIHSLRCLQSISDALKFSSVFVENSTKKPRNRVHGRKNSCEIDRNVVSQNGRISSLARDGRIEEARQVFDKMPKRSIVSWNSMITGYACNGRINDARQLFDDMPERDVVSWNAMVSGYIRDGRLEVSRQIFDEMPERDIVSWNSMISGYARRGDMENALQLFERMGQKNLVTWNMMLFGYVQVGRFDDARHVFDKMLERDAVSWNTMITAYAQNGRMLEARCLFDAMPETNTVSWNVMITGHAQKGQMSIARQLFDRMPRRDVVTWTAMVTGYFQNGNIDDARQMFDKMPERNIISWNSMIAGYAQNGRMEDASHLFRSMPTHNVASWNAMISGYAQNGQIEESRRAFDEMPARDSLSWTSIIAGYCQNDQGEEALKLFLQMMYYGLKPVESTFTCVLSACANLAVLEQGKQIHCLCIKTGFEPGVIVGNSMITMYCKCGNIGDAYCVFEKMSVRDVISWNAIIAGYAQHGCGEEALQLFEQMKQLGIKPNHITLVGVLSACSHAGLVDKGQHYFYSMTRDLGIAATSEHYTCMVDLLGRAGHLAEVEDFVNNMSIEPNARVWGALLGASRIHGNIELGQRAAERIFELEPHNAGMYVLLCNMYTAAGRTKDAADLRVTMKHRGVKKEPGCSWIEVGNKIHAFIVGDKSHPDVEKIYAMLEILAEGMKEAGYVPLTNSMLHDVDY